MITFVKWRVDRGVCVVGRGILSFMVCKGKDTSFIYFYGEGCIAGVGSG